jgi:hypothetical protein
MLYINKNCIHIKTRDAGTGGQGGVAMPPCPLPWGGGARRSNVPFQSEEFSTLDGVFIVENTLSAWSQLNYWHNIVPNMGFTSAQKAN